MGACGVPLSEAPELFAYDAASHCYVTKQPTSDEELDRAFRAAWAAELQCIRYRGADPEILRRFAELDEPHLCDVPPPAIAPLVRDLVRFTLSPNKPHQSSAFVILQSFREFLRGLDAERAQIGLSAEYRYRLGNVVDDASVASLTFAWFAENFHKVECRQDEVRSGWQVQHFSVGHAGDRGVSNLLHDWLKTSEQFGCIRWFSAGAKDQDEPPRPSPQ